MSTGGGDVCRGEGVDIPQPENVQEGLGNRHLIQIRGHSESRRRVCVGWRPRAPVERKTPESLDLIPHNAKYLFPFPSPSPNRFSCPLSSNLLFLISIPLAVVFLELEKTILSASTPAETPSRGQKLPPEDPTQGKGVRTILPPGGAPSPIFWPS